jgi:hypothetical protein
MALTDLFKLHDPALMEKYQAKPYDASKDRAAFKKALDGVVTQMNEGRTKVPNRMWSVSNDVVKFEPKFKGRPVALMGETVLTIPKERFEEAIDILKSSVDEGELDDVLEGSVGGKKASAAKSQPSSSEPAPNRSLAQVLGSALRYGWDEQKLIDRLYEKGCEEEQIDPIVQQFRDKSAKK